MRDKGLLIRRLFLRDVLVRVASPSDESDPFLCRDAPAARLMESLISYAICFPGAAALACDDKGHFEHDQRRLLGLMACLMHAVECERENTYKILYMY